MSISEGNLHLIIEDIKNPFIPARFNIRRLPIKIGDINGLSFPDKLPCCLDMLIKVPKSSVVVPAPYSSSKAIMQVVNMAFEFEDGILQSWRDTHYAYITIDQRHVVPGKSHRNAGWHFDGMQGSRYPDKLDVCHQYVVSDHLPTEYSDHAVDASDLDYVDDNWFVELGSQIPDDATLFKPKPYEIMMMSAYQMHRSPVAGPDDGGRRTFIRIDITQKHFDRVGNTINPELAPPFDFHERPLPFLKDTEVNDTNWNGAEKLVSQ